MPVLLLGTVAAMAPTQARDGADDVTVYRCTDAQGRVSLQDLPCSDGQRQQVRSMLRPQDPPPRAAAPADTPAAVVAASAPETLVRTPRPMYECVTPEGERYTSDSGDGNPRPAPVWGGGFHLGARSGHGHGQGVPPAPHTMAERRAAGIASPGMSTSPGPSLTAPNPPRAASAPPPRPGPPGRPGYGYGYGYGYGGSGDGWIRDRCRPLPQAEVCARLNDRRGEIRRRTFNAQPTERAELRGEDRDITARLNDDCDIR